jgi:hypothetical protein
MARRFSNDIMAIILAAVASSLVTFAILIASGWIGMPKEAIRPLDIAVWLSIILIWAPAFALVPAAVLGFLLERPLSRRLIARREGGFIEHLLLVVATAVALWLALRIAVVMSGPQTRILDPLSLAVFAIIGVCSALSWWFLVVLPGRRG